MCHNLLEWCRTHHVMQPHLSLFVFLCALLTGRYFFLKLSTNNVETPKSPDMNMFSDACKNGTNNSICWLAAGNQGRTCSHLNVRELTDHAHAEQTIVFCSGVGVSRGENQKRTTNVPHPDPSPLPQSNRSIFPILDLHDQPSPRASLPTLHPNFHFPSVRTDRRDHVA